ncbi:hypothetical protein ACFQOZ_15020 [Comamonas endophytica]|uniref:hypothetical protein n=1 Tax=Comamonas endophytica TaxID=2949090 RepID=UPI003613046F
MTLATLIDGRLVAHTNAQGERAYMDEATRAQERQRAQGIIASDCGPGAGTAAPRTQPAGPATSATVEPNTLPSSATPANTPRPEVPGTASRRDPTPPELARPGAPRPGRPEEPTPPTIQ